MCVVCVCVCVCAEMQHKMTEHNIYIYKSSYSCYTLLGDKRAEEKEISWIERGNSEITFDSIALILEEDSDLTGIKQSKTLQTVQKPSYKYTPKSASCSDEETLTLSKKDDTPKVCECSIGMFSSINYSAHIKSYALA